MGHDSSDDGMKLKPGTVVTSSKNAFVVMKLLGEGGFGAVYKVHDQDDKTKMYAMKVEKKVATLKLVAQERTSNSSHFTTIIDRGKKEKYFFLVMTFVGRSLDDLKQLRPHRVFSIGTGIGASYQCLEAIEDLDKWGFIHRDIKPANFARELDNKRRTVYLLDFGIARRILNDENELKEPREKVGSKGTVRFASLSCHRGVEMGPKNDYDFTCYSTCWRSLVATMQRRERTVKRKDLFSGLVRCQSSLEKMLDYSDRVGYTFIFMLLRIAAAEYSADLSTPYDWKGTEPDMSKRRTAHASE